MTGGRRGLSPTWTAAGLVALLICAGALWVLKPWKSGVPPAAITLEAGREVTLYFAPPTGGEYQTRPLRLLGKLAWGEQIKNLLESMFHKPAGPEEVSLWPFTMKVRAVYLLKNGSLILDLEEGVAYNQNASAAAEWRVLRSLVHTLTKNFPEVNSVKFLVNGAEAETLAGHVDISRGLGDDE